MSEGVDLKVIAARTAGFAGADLANLVNEAALLAARKDKTSVEMRDFDDAIDRIIAGLEKKRVMSDKERRIVAYTSPPRHRGERAAGSRPGAQDLDRGAGLRRAGYTMQLPPKTTYRLQKPDLMNQLSVLLGGRSAEEIAFGEISTALRTTCSAPPISRVRWLTHRHERGVGVVNLPVTSARRSSIPVCAGTRDMPKRRRANADAEVKRILDEAHDTARRELRARRDVLDRLSERLLEIEVIEAEELQRILGPALPS